MQHHQKALIGHALVVRREAGNVVAAPDDHGASALAAGALCGQIDGLQHQPRTRQALAVPGHCGRVVRHHQRLALFAHLARLQLGQIRGEQGQAVRVMAQQIAFEQHIGHGVRFVGWQASRLQKLVSKSQKVRGRIVHGLHHKKKLWMCCRHLDSVQALAFKTTSPPHTESESPPQCRAAPCPSWHRPRLRH
jgi:hypothetical protein